MVKKGIPKEILENLDIHKKKPKKAHIVTLTVEEHQAKIPIPVPLRLQMELKKGTQCEMTYDKEKKEIVCRLL